MAIFTPEFKIQEEAKARASLTPEELQRRFDLTQPAPPAAPITQPITTESIQKGIDDLNKQFQVSGFKGLETSAVPVITPEKLVSTETPIKVPEAAPAIDTSASVAAGAKETSKSIEDYIKLLTPAETPESKKVSELAGQIEGLLPGAEGRGAAQLEAEKLAGTPELKKSLIDINTKIKTKLAEYDAMEARVEGQPGVVKPIIAGQLAQLRKVKASEIGLLQAEAEGVRGNLTLAQETANRSVDLKYEDAINSINLRLKQLDLLGGRLSKKEKIRSDAVELYLQDRKDKLNVTIANEKDKNATLLNLMQKYPDAGIVLTDTLEQANQKIVSKSAIYRKETAISPIPSPTPTSDAAFKRLKELVGQNPSTGEIGGRNNIPNGAQWDRVADQIDREFGAGTATRFDSYLKNAYVKGASGTSDPLGYENL